LYAVVETDSPFVEMLGTGALDPQAPSATACVTIGPQVNLGGTTFRVRIQQRTHGFNLRKSTRDSGTLKPCAQ
jgi:hypothetical protein